MRIGGRRKINVICIMMDTWRFDYAGCYGNKKIKTPNLDRFASEATLFENAYSEGVPTLPARMACFTGRYTFPFRPWQQLETHDVLLSSALDRAGYTTALISDTLPMRGDTLPNVRNYLTGNYMMGFKYVEWSDQTYFWLPRAPWLPKAKVTKEIIYRYWKDRGDHRDAIFRERIKRQLEARLLWRSDEDSFVAQTIKKAIAWLERQKDLDHIFLWLDTWDPHEPWDPPSPFDTMYIDPNYDGPRIIRASDGPVEGYLNEDELECIRGLYAGEVSMCDKWLGIFLNKVEELGLMENSLIIFLSDHGNFHGEHGLIHKARCWPYECMSHIPLIIKLPDETGRGKRIDAFVDTTDIMPTILDFLEIKLPPARTTHEMLHGHSLLPLIRGEVDKVRECAYMGWYRRAWAIREGDWKYIMYSGQNFVFTGKTRPELFNLRKDPHELENVIDEHQDLADQLELKLRRFVSGLPPTLPSPPPRGGPAI